MNNFSQSIVLIKKELWQRRWSIIAYSLIAFSFLWMYVAIYPTFQHESQKFNELLQSYPKALLQAFNIEQLQMGTIEGFVAMEHLSFIYPFMSILLMLSFAGSAIAGEVESGTMSQSLVLPVNRKRLFASKYLAGLIVLVVFLILSVLALIPLAASVGLTIDNSHVLMTALLCGLFAWAILAFGFAVSSFAKEKSTVYFTVGGVLLIMYVLNIVSGLVSSLKWLRYESIFYYFQPANVLTQGVLSKTALITLSVVIIVLSVVGLMRFTRRDISV